jgi:uridine phosphorylase
MMKDFFDASPPLLNPADLVRAVTGKNRDQLALPGRAIVTVNSRDLQKLTSDSRATMLKSWAPFREIYRLGDTDTVVTRSNMGGPNIAALVEEFSSFGVGEFIFWGYCGSLALPLNIGDIITVRGALREEGTSYHYLPGKERFVYSNWYDAWKERAAAFGLSECLVWTCDAIYRETADKVENFGRSGVAGVEMEVASLYAVCNYLKVKSIAFLVVSDLFEKGVWTHGFHSVAFKEGVRRILEFMRGHCVSSTGCP